MHRITLPLIGALLALAAMPHHAQAGWRRGPIIAAPRAAWVAPPRIRVAPPPPVWFGPPVVSYQPA